MSVILAKGVASNRNRDKRRYQVKTINLWRRFACLFWWRHHRQQAPLTEPFTSELLLKKNTTGGGGGGGP